ncbi:unnamed protein product [Caenorhabditis auriculariae]|uniref:Uncharacterized protein n=1 Tax=Caenorhabditis auriculariae TaxID=2777116 RepID=A0A8S1GTR8_9PELO|nr:unnamed protein product [Caenorhabditis auriculariae]
MKELFGRQEYLLCLWLTFLFSSFSWKETTNISQTQRGKMIQNVADGMANILTTAEKVRGWKLVQKTLPRIIEYGRSEGILQVQATSNAFNITGIVIAAQEEAHTQKEPRAGDKVNLPTNDITMMHEAIPFLPVPVAITCLIFNILIPGSGTILSGFSALCGNQPVFFTITFLFVGWFWSIAWGGLLLIHSMQYREALQQRRQEAVATAAIEALTKDSILHRRDVKTLARGTPGVPILFACKLDTQSHAEAHSSGRSTNCWQCETDKAMMGPPRKMPSRLSASRILSSDKAERSSSAPPINRHDKKSVFLDQSQRLCQTKSMADGVRSTAAKQYQILNVKSSLKHGDTKSSPAHNGAMNQSESEPSTECL